MRYRTHLLILFFLLLTASLALRDRSRIVYGLAVNLTVPTRTPTAAPATATSPSGGGGGGGGSNPTATAVSPTRTPTRTVIDLAPTPIGGFVSTVEPCSLNPVVQANSAINVRSGPGTEFATSAELVYLEVRPIVGRYANGEWWQIILADGSLGWVADFVVTISGNTTVIPIVDDSPGTPWLPTPNPDCPPAAVWTSTPIPATETAVPPTPTVEVATATAVSDGTPPPALTPVGLQIESNETPVGGAPVAVALTSTAVPLSTPEPALSTARVFPLASLGLLVVGAAFVWMRQNNSAE